jgi:ankyrin repeat protein
MKLLLLLFCCIGFSLEGMQAVVKKEPKQVAKEQAQAFWAVASALSDGEIDKAKALVTENPKVLGCWDAQKRTLLHYSLEKKCTPFSLWLVSLPECRLDACDQLKRSPLHRATFLGETAVVAALIKRNASFTPAVCLMESESAGWKIFDAVKNKRNSPLHDAIETRSADIASIIEQHKELVDSPNADGNTPLHLAASSFDEKAAALLVAAGATINVLNVSKLSPLHCAIATSNTSMSAFLLHAVGSLTEAGVVRLLAKQPRSEEAHASEVVRLLNDEKNFERHTEALVTITNDTSWRLKLTYALAGKTGEIIILQGDQFLLYGDLTKLSALEVAIYGKQWGYAQLKPIDLYKPWHVENSAQPDYTYEIKVSGEKSAFWQYVTPFVITSHGNGGERYRPPSRVSKEGLIGEAFPCVVAAIKKGKAVSARNFLQVSSSATREAVDLAYERLNILWKRQRTITQKAYVDRVRALLRIAHERITAQNSATDFYQPGEKIPSRDMSGPLSQPALGCLRTLYQEMGTITPEVLSQFLKKFRREELVRLLTVRDVLGKTALYTALKKGNNQLFMLLLAKEMGDSF